MKTLDPLLKEIEILIPKQELLMEKVSTAAIGWHIEHSLLTINAIIDQLKRSNPEDYKWKFNFTRTLVFTINKIPRGRAKAPKVVQPKSSITMETLKLHFNNTKENITALQKLQINNHFEHPFFGKLNLKPASKFLYLHTNHHLKIMKDIAKFSQKN